MNDPFIKLPTEGGDLYIRRSQVLMLEPNTGPAGGCFIYFRLSDHTSSRRLLCSCEQALAVIEQD